MSEQIPEKRNPEETLNYLLSELQSNDAARVLTALEELGELTFSSPAILSQLEKLAIQNPDEDIHRHACDILDNSTHRYIRSRLSKLPLASRKIILDELAVLQQEGLLDSSSLDVIKHRYDFDITPPPAKPETVSAPPAPPASQPEPTEQTSLQTPPTTIPEIGRSETSSQPEPVAPRRSLLEALLSETSIKIALYLGAFFVVASALILAALVAAARLPILFAATALFGIGALVINKRLPQPSFALFIVFSFLLPITANVMDEQLSLKEPGLSVYWFIVALLMAMVWAYATRIYSSRLFTITSFLSLDVSIYRLANTLQEKAQPELFLIALGLSALVGLAGTRLLKKWKDNNFALPLFFLIQIQLPVLLFLSLSFSVVHLYDTEFALAWWLAGTAVWVLAFAFYVWSEALYPFPLFPWLAGAALIPISWFFIQTFDPTTRTVIVTQGVWGLLLSAASEAVHRSEANRKFGLPLLLASLPLFIVAQAWGLIENVTLGFACLLGIFIVYATLHTIRPRGWLWTIALFAGVGAYFSFFELSIFENIHVFFGFELLGLTLLLLASDLFLKADWKDNPTWRLTPRILGAFIVTWNFLLLTFAETNPSVNRIIIFGIYAVFFALYSLRYVKARLGYIAALSTALAVLYAANHFDDKLWLPALTGLTLLFFMAGLLIKRGEETRAWSDMLRYSGLALGAVVSFVAVIQLERAGGWYILPIAAIFLAERFITKQSLFELVADILLPSAWFLILEDFKIKEITYALLGFSLIWFSMDTIFSRIFKGRMLEQPTRGLAALATLANTIMLVYVGSGSLEAPICFGAYTVFFVIYAFVYRKAWLGYSPAAYLPLTIVFTLNHFKLDYWLPALTALSIIYFAVGYLIKANKEWAEMLRNSGLALGSIVSFVALLVVKENGGYYTLVTGLLFAIETFLRQNGSFEIGMPALFNIGVFLILHDFKVIESAYHLLAYSLVWLGSDLFHHLTFKALRPLQWPVRGIGVLLVGVNTLLLITATKDASHIAWICFAALTVFFLAFALLYKKPVLGYLPAVYLPLTTFFLLRDYHQDKWLFPLIGIAIVYYACGYLLRRAKRGDGWETTLLFSGIGLGTISALTAPLQGGLDAAIPVAIAATIWAIEAFARSNVWLGFPANALYLMAYFMILLELKVDEPQFFSIGAALLGMIMHYMLTRTGSKTGAFITGMVSQLVLLSTTYIQMVNTEKLSFFVVLFFQSLAVMIYGIVIRSRSLVFTPIIFSVIGVITVIYSALKGLSTAILIGCTGIVFLLLGILAVVMRERITKIGERFSDWQA